MAIVPGKTIAQMVQETVTQDTDLFYFLRGTGDYGISFGDLRTSFLGTLTIATGSQPYLGYDPVSGELSMKALAITDVTVDGAETSLANWIATNYTAGDELQEGDVLYLTAATGGTEIYIHNGGTAGDATDFEVINLPVVTSLTGLSDTAPSAVNNGFLQWNAGGTQVDYITSIDEVYGGTGQTTYATGDILYASGANTLSKLAIGAANQYLQIVGGVPTWQTLAVADTNILDTDGLASTTAKTHTIGNAAPIQFESEGSVPVFRMVGGASPQIGIRTTSPTQALQVGDETINAGLRVVGGVIGREFLYLNGTGTFKNTGGNGGGNPLHVLKTGTDSNWSKVATFETEAAPYIEIKGTTSGNTLTQNFSAANNYLDFRFSAGTGQTAFMFRGNGRFGVNTGNGVQPSANAHIVGLSGVVPFRVDTNGVDNALTVESTANVIMNGTGATTLQRGLTGDRPTGVNGMIRYNTTTNKFEGYENGGWADLISAGGVDTGNILDTDALTMATNKTHTIGSNQTLSFLDGFDSDPIFAIQSVGIADRGRVGIGTTTPTAKLDIVQTGIGQSPFRVVTSGVEALNISNTGVVRVGTNAGSYMFQVQAKSGTTNIFNVLNSSATSLFTINNSITAIKTDKTHINGGGSANLSVKGSGLASVFNVQNSGASIIFSVTNTGVTRVNTALGVNANAGGVRACVIQAATGSVTQLLALRDSSGTDRFRISNIGDTFLQALPVTTDGGFSDSSKLRLTGYYDSDPTAGVTSTAYYGDIYMDMLNATPSGNMTFRVNNATRMTIGSDQVVSMVGTGATKLQAGLTGDRPTGVNGMIRYNNTSNRFEGYQNGGWINLDDGTAA